VTRGVSTAPAGVGLDVVLRWAASEQGLPVGLALDVARRTADAIESWWRDGATAPGLRTPAAARLMPDGSIELVDLGGRSGEPAYEAPELQRADERADERADLFGLGAILFELLAGRPLDAGGDPGAGAPPDLGEERPDAPAPLVELLFELLCAAPAGRPRSAVEVSARLVEMLEGWPRTEGDLDLRELARQLGATAPGLAAAAGPPPAARGREARRDAVVVALLLLLSAVAGCLLRVILP
jgi:hypothetical protein